MIIYLGSGKTRDCFAKFRFSVRYPWSVKECFNGKSIEVFLRFIAETFENFSKFCITNPQISQTWVSDFGYPIRNWKSRFWIPVQNPKLGFQRPDKSLSFLLFLFGQGRILHSIDFMQGNFFSDNNIQKLYKIDWWIAIWQQQNFQIIICCTYQSKNWFLCVVSIHTGLFRTKKYIIINVRKSRNLDLKNTFDTYCNVFYFISSKFSNYKCVFILNTDYTFLVRKLTSVRYNFLNSW